MWPGYTEAMEMVATEGSGKASPEGSSGCHHLLPQSTKRPWVCDDSGTIIPKTHQNFWGLCSTRYILLPVDNIFCVSREKRTTNQNWLVRYLPPLKILVSWDDYSRDMEKKSCSSHHQPENVYLTSHCNIFESHCPSSLAMLIKASLIGSREICATQLPFPCVESVSRGDLANNLLYRLGDFYLKKIPTSSDVYQEVILPC